MRRSLKRLWRLCSARLGWRLCRRGKPGREARQKLNRRDLFALVRLKHLENDIDNLLDLVVALAAAKPLVQLAQYIDGCFKVLARDRRNALLGSLARQSRSDVARVLVQARFLRLLQRNVVRGAWELLLDDVELAEDELDLADLPLCFVVGCALVVLAAEQRPVGNVARAGFVAAKVIGNDLARQVFGVLARLATCVFVVHANELTMDVGHVFVIFQSLLCNIVKLGLLRKPVSISMYTLRVVQDTN